MLNSRWRASLCFYKENKFRIILEDKKGFFYNLISKFKHLEEVEVKIIKWRNKRTLHQNSYYWGVVLKIFADHLGYTEEELHEALKRKFLSIETVKGLPTNKSTSKLNTKEMTEYIENIKEFASIDFQVYIPDVDDEILKYC